MRDTNPNPAPPDLLALVHARSGNPRRRQRLPDNAPMLAAMAIEARRVARQAQLLAEELSAAAARCRKPACKRCGKPLTVRETGRPPEYCGDTCGRGARRSRSAETPKDAA